MKLNHELWIAVDCDMARSSCNWAITTGEGRPTVEDGLEPKSIESKPMRRFKAQKPRIELQMLGSPVYKVWLISPRLMCYLLLQFLCSEGCRVFRHRKSWLQAVKCGEVTSEVEVLSQSSTLRCLQTFLQWQELVLPRCPYLLELFFRFANCSSSVNPFRQWFLHWLFLLVTSVSIRARVWVAIVATIWARHCSCLLAVSSFVRDRASSPSV